MLESTTAPTDKLVLTAREVCAALGIKRRKLYDITSPRGSLPSLTLADVKSATTRYLREDVIQYLRDRRDQCNPGLACR